MINDLLNECSHILNIVPLLMMADGLKNPGWQYNQISLTLNSWYYLMPKGETHISVRCYLVPSLYPRIHPFLRMCRTYLWHKRSSLHHTITNIPTSFIIQSDCWITPNFQVTLFYLLVQVYLGDLQNVFSTIALATLCRTMIVISQ